MTKAFDNYCIFVSEVLGSGTRVSPRGQETAELTGTEFSFHSTQMFYRPGMNTALGWAELLMLLGGFYDPEVIRYAAPRADMSLYNPKLMYGWRVRDQYSGLIAAFENDQDTREAILVIGSGADGATWDQPCTTSVQFLFRGGVLDAYVSMRSQDLIKGLPYDVMMFGGLTQAVANQLAVEPGSVTIRHGSAHVYKSDLQTLLPVVEKRATYHLGNGVLQMVGGVARYILESDWKPIPSVIRRTDWEVVE